MREAFPVYLTDAELSANDEYVDADPYAVEEELADPFHKRRIELTLALIREFGGTGSVKILDVGCGEGHITSEIKKALPDARIHAFDLSISAIRKAHENNPEISFAVADALNSPYPAGPFDIVVCNNLWEHVTEPLRLLARIKEVLAPGGVVIISTPSRYRTSNLLRVILGRPVARMSAHHVTEYTVGQMKEMLAWGGFSVRRAISRPEQTGSLKGRIARFFIALWLRLTGSHHELEATVFYAAATNPGTAAVRSRTDPSTRQSSKV